jgi:DNA mismatch repair protein MSH4
MHANLQANCNRLLDVARETYKENVGDIYNLNRTLSETHNLPLSPVYQENGGFVFTLKKSELEDAGGELPRGFVNVTMQKGRWLFSSLDLVSLFCYLYRGVVSGCGTAVDIV